MKDKFLFRAPLLIGIGIGIVAIWIILTAYESDNLFTGNFAPGPVPDHIIMNLTEAPATSFAVNWRTDQSVASGTVEYAEATHGPEFKENKQSIKATTEAYDKTKENANYHSAIISGLKPNTKYVYRVGQGEYWSEWFQIQTPNASDNSFSFVYFGDAQNDLKSMWSRVIREAYAKMPQVDFMLHAGDLVNNNDNDYEWGEWFYAGSFIHSMVPSVMTPGNHEYKNKKLSPQWKPQFNLPKNGPENADELSEVCYYIDYENMRLISISSTMILKDNKSLAKQKAWIEKVLQETDKEWIAVFTHHPLYATKPGRDHETLRENFKPIFDQYGVDIVLQGHDHAYGRGHNVTEGVTMQDNAIGTMYVVSVSGPKMYEVDNSDWMERRARNTQLFQLITIENNKLLYRAYTAKGDLYDAFEITKTEEGKRELKNIDVEMPERLD